MSKSCGILSNSPLISNSRTKSDCQHLLRVIATASNADLFGQYPYESAKNNGSTMGSKQVLLPFVLFDQKQWAFLKCIHLPISLVLEPLLPEVENNILMTYDSKSYKDYLSDFCRNHLAIVDRHPTAPALAFTNL